jgi:cobalt-zinc-cadmium efflux system protein
VEPAHAHAGHAHGHEHAGVERAGGEVPGRHVHQHEGRAAEQGTNQRRLLLVICMGLVLLVAEVVGGLLANSLALYSDAAHVSTDVAALAIAYAAIRIAARPPSSSKSYGYYRAEVVAAFVNALALWGICAYLVYEAWQRLFAPPEVDGRLVMIIGGVSLVANLGMAAILHRGHEHNLNMRSAYLHVLSDALGSLAALIAGIGVTFYGAHWLDPATTLFISALILVWTYRLTRDTLHVLLEGTPVAVKHEEVRDTIASVPGVVAVHDLHVWSLTAGVDNLSAHVQVSDGAQGPRVVREIRVRLREKHSLSHVTIEVETDETECVGCN